MSPDQKFPRLLARITEVLDDSYTVTVWFRGRPGLDRDGLLTDQAVGSIEEAHAIIQKLAAKNNIASEDVDIDPDLIDARTAEWREQKPN